MSGTQCFNTMLKIPTFVLGGLLILTGLLGYLLQDPSLSIKIKGSLADNANLTLSDGNQTQLIDLGFVSGKESAGDQAKEIISRFYGEGDSIMGVPPGPATKAAQTNNAIEHYDKGPDGIESFWFASSRGETLEKLIQHTENDLNVGNPDYKKIPVDWNEVDTNSSTIKLVYINAAGNSGPATLKVSNWKNIDLENPPKDGILNFKKSLTAFIPSLIGLVLILLVLAADAKASARKHIMHVAVLLGLFGFIMVVKRIGPAVAEMTWLRGEPNGIMQASSLKPTTMLVSAGLLLIFVIICVVSFIQARKEKVAQAKKDSLAKKKAGKDQFEDKEEKKEKDSKGISGSTKSKVGEQNAEKDKAKDTPKGSNTKSDSSKPKSPNSAGDSAKKTTSSDTKGLPARKPVDKKKSTTVTEEKKDSGKSVEASKEKPKTGMSGDSETRKGSNEKFDKAASSSASKEPEESNKRKNITDSRPKKTSEEDKGSSYKKTDDKSDDSRVSRDSSEDSPEEK
jgi:hypothetical protein